MIIDDFDILGAGVRPTKADPELVIDPDRMLTFPICLERMQTVGRWNLLG